jgi:hypothetical protein
MPSSDGPSSRRYGEPVPPEAMPGRSRPRERAGADDDRGGSAAGVEDASSHLEPGPTFLVVFAAYGALLAATGACLAALALGVRSAGTLYVLGGYGWLFGTAVLGAGLWRYGVPRPLRPRALYPWRGLGLVAVPPVAAVAGYLGVAAVTDPTPGGAVLAAFVGSGAALPGWVLWFLARNGLARTWRERATREWTGARSRDRIRRRQLLGGALAGVLAAASVVRILRGGPQLFGVAVVGLVLLANAGEELTVAVTPGGLVVGGAAGRYYRVVPWSSVAAVEHRDGTLVFRRHGVRPSLSFDAGAVEEPAAVVRAARAQFSRRRTP